MPNGGDINKKYTLILIAVTVSIIFEGGLQSLIH